ncbi:hypothetical protein GGR57DRAFT_167344 [Xylariaceae sp. FL1272]|nr:hypothetical protein GGR57DRAFT_167344 [Xylariaceae sp. FL1272]
MMLAIPCCGMWLPAVSSHAPQNLHHIITLLRAAYTIDATSSLLPNSNSTRTIVLLLVFSQPLGFRLLQRHYSMFCFLMLTSHEFHAARSQAKR